MKHFVRYLAVLSLLVPINVLAQSTNTNFSGMWSDPPDTPEGLFCFFNCSDYGLEELGRLLDDPANDDRSYGELTGEANRAAAQALVVPILTDAAVAAGRISGAEDPGFINSSLGVSPNKFLGHTRMKLLSPMTI